MLRLPSEAVHLPLATPCVNKSGPASESCQSLNLGLLVPLVFPRLPQTDHDVIKLRGDFPDRRD